MSRPNLPDALPRILAPLVQATLCLVVAVLAALTPRAAPTRADEVASYRAAVERALAAAERARGASGEAQSAALAEARGALEAVTPLPVGGAATLAPENDPIVFLLAPDGDLDVAVSRLRALLAALDSFAAPEAVPKARAEQALRDVLARPEYRPRGQSLQEYLWERFLQYVVRPIFERLPRGEGTLNTLLLLGLITGVLVLGFVTWRMQGTLNPRALREAAGGAVVTVRSLGEQRLADLEAARGNYRQALHHLYLALLYELDDTGRLRFDPSLTNRELVEQSGAGSELVALVDRYDATWYALADVTAAEFLRFRQAIEAQRAEARPTRDR